MFGSIFSMVIVILIIMVIFSMIVIVPEKQEVIVEMLGKYHKTMRAGVNYQLSLTARRANYKMFRYSKLLDLPHKILYKK